MGGTRIGAGSHVVNISLNTSLLSVHSPGGLKGPHSPGHPGRALCCHPVGGKIGEICIQQATVRELRRAPDSTRNGAPDSPCPWAVLAAQAGLSAPRKWSLERGQLKVYLRGRILRGPQRLDRCLASRSGHVCRGPGRSWGMCRASCAQ